MPTPTLVALCPVLNRPNNLGPLVQSFNDSLDGENVEASMLFLVNTDDPTEIAELEKRGLWHIVVPWGNGPRDFPRKINWGAARTSSDWMLIVGDDVRFHRGWFRAAINKHIETGALVIGTNDTVNPTVVRGDHATHPLVHRDYLEQGTIDEPGILLHPGYAHNSCNPPEAPVWMADLTFKALGDVRVGDEIMGWHRPARDHLSREQIDDLLVSGLSNRHVGRLVGVSYMHVGNVRNGKVRWEDRYRPWKMPLKRLCGAEVRAVQTRSAPLVRVQMESGREFRCTPDHLWMNGNHSPSVRYGKEWINAAVGRTLLHVIDQPRRLARDEEWLAGWLGGIYDGEGSGVYAATQSILRNPEVCEAITTRLTELGIFHSIPDGTEPGVKHFSMLGGRQTFLNFLTWCKPVKSERLEAKIKDSARFGMRDKIVAVDPAAPGEVVSMTTKTGNYVVWGYASKNCDVEFVETAKVRGQFAHARNSVVAHIHPTFNRTVKRDSTYQKGMEYALRDKQLFRRRRRLWDPSAPEVRETVSHRRRVKPISTWPVR